MRSMVRASIAVAVLSFLILLLWAQTKIEPFQRRAAINPRRILALTCFLVLMLGVNVALSAPLWGIACGDGRVDTILDDFDSPWVVCCTAAPSIPKPTPRTVPGCHGNAMAVDYDLRNVAPPDSPNAGQSYIVLQRFFSSPRDLTNYTHIRLAWHGSNINSHDSIDVKLHDGHNLFATSLQSMTDLSANTADGQPVWRVIYLDLREFTGNGSIDLAHIDRLEIGIVRCTTMPGMDCEVFDNPSFGGPPEQHVGTLYLDEFAAVNLRPGAVNRLVETGFETVTPNPTVRANAANGLLARIVSSGPGMDLIPAWFPETTPNFNSYVQAETLLVFVNEYERTGNVAFRDAAQKIAAKLLSLQIPSGRTQSGAWYTSYGIQDGVLIPPDRASRPLLCDGNETLLQDISQSHPRMQQVVDNGLRRIVPPEVLEINKCQCSIRSTDGVVKPEIRRAQRSCLTTERFVECDRGLTGLAATPFSHSDQQRIQGRVDPLVQRAHFVVDSARAPQAFEPSLDVRHEVSERKTRFRCGRERVAVRHVAQPFECTQKVDQRIDVFSRDRARGCNGANDVLVGPIADCMQRVEAKTIKMKFLDPVASIGDEKLTDRCRIRAVEIDRVAPFIFISASQIIVRKSTQIISLRTEVVIDDVENDTQA